MLSLGLALGTVIPDRETRTLGPIETSCNDVSMCVIAPTEQTHHRHKKNGTAGIDKLRRTTQSTMLLRVESSVICMGGRSPLREPTRLFNRYR